MKYWKPAAVGVAAAVVGTLLTLGALRLLADDSMIRAVWQVELQRAQQAGAAK